MTTAQRDAIVTPVAGLMVFNTSRTQINYYDGTTWRAIGDYTTIVSEAAFPNTNVASGATVTNAYSYAVAQAGNYRITMNHTNNGFAFDNVNVRVGATAAVIGTLSYWWEYPTTTSFTANLAANNVLNFSVTENSANFGGINTGQARILIERLNN